MSACELMEDTTLTDAQRLAHTVACVKESRGNGDVFYILWASLREIEIRCYMSILVRQQVRG